MAENTTVSKTIEQKLIESEARYRHLFNTTPYGIWLVDMRGKIIDCNETMGGFLSVFKREDLIGKSFKEVLEMFLREGDPRWEGLEKRLRERFLRLIKKEVLEPIEFEISRADGKTYWITLESSFVEYGDNQIIQTFIKDITERKLAEIELAELRKSLEERVKTRTLKLESSEMKYRKAYNRAKCFKGLFTHDISNMFQTISNSLELCDSLLKEGIEREELVEYFTLIDQQLSRGKKLIKNIRNLSELEESEMPLEPVNVFETLRSAIQYTRVHFPKRDININDFPSNGGVYVLANELLLDVFENILINSIVYNRSENVQLEIEISKYNEVDKDYVKIEFRDNGLGIKDQRKEEIFQENHEIVKPTSGMGLGLSLVAKLIDLCEGKIWVEDRIQGDYTKGSNFKILIPEAQ